MRIFVFARRNYKEIMRDKISLIFGVGFPVVLILLLSCIQSNIPVKLFTISKLAPGIAVFGLSFISLFSGILIAKDRSASFMLRLLASPLRPVDFILGYALPLLPIAIFEIILCLFISLFLGLSFSIRLLVSVIVLIPPAILFIAIGILCGILFNEKQVGSICGALLTNLTAWLSGIWFDLNLVGSIFKKIADVLPFVHAVNAGTLAIEGSYTALWPDLTWVIFYDLLFMPLAIFVFMKKIKSNAI